MGNIIKEIRDPWKILIEINERKILVLKARQKWYREIHNNIFHEAEKLNRKVKVIS
jgi:hypothetical protein